MAWERGRGQPNVQRAQNLIVNEAGEFSAPVSLNGVEYESMLTVRRRMPASLNPLCLMMSPCGTSR